MHWIFLSSTGSRERAVANVPVAVLVIEILHNPHAALDIPMQRYDIE